MAAAGVKLLLVGALVGTGLVGLSQQDLAPRALATDVGFVRVAHLSPDTAPFDAYIMPAGSTKPAITVRNLSYGQLSAYQRLAPGGYTVTVRGAGTGERGVVLLAGAVHVDSGKTYTLGVSGLRTQLSLRVIGDDVRPASNGRARIRALNAAPKLDPAEVDVESGQVLWQEVGFGTVSSYVDLPAGKHTVQIFGRGAAEPAATVPVTLTANAVYSMLILDGPDGARIALRADAAAPAEVPTGPVETGLGGASLPAALALPQPVDLAPVARPGRPVPVQLGIPRLHVLVPVAALHLSRGGTLVPPANAAVAGWYAGGVLPGEPGPAVLAGHVDSRTGPGVFFGLHTLRAGDAVSVRRSDGTILRYVVTQVAHYPKKHFPTDTVYETRPDSELRLITCGGVFDESRHSYADNVVVTAVPA